MYLLASHRSNHWNRTAEAKAKIARFSIEYRGLLDISKLVYIVVPGQL
jgi:hypothetical protein